MCGAHVGVIARSYSYVHLSLESLAEETEYSLADLRAASIDRLDQITSLVGHDRCRSSDRMKGSPSIGFPGCVPLVNIFRYPCWLSYLQPPLGPYQGSIYWGGGELLPQTLKLPPQKFSQMQFKIMA